MNTYKNTRSKTIPTFSLTATTNQVNFYHLFSFLFLILTFLTTLNNSFARELFQFQQQIIRNVIVQLVFLLSIAMIIQKKMSAKSWALFSAVSLIILLSSYFSGETSFINIILYCAAVNKEDENKVIKSLLIGTLFAVSLVLLMNFFGLIPNYIQISGEHRIRNSLGFNQPVLLPGFILNIGIAYIFLNRKNITLLKILYLLIPALTINYSADGRGSTFAVVTICIFSYLVTKYRLNENEKIISRIVFFSKSVYLFLFAFSIYSAHNFMNSGWLQILNRILTGRISLFSEYWQMYNITIFGQEMIRVTQFAARGTDLRAIVLDNAYLSMLLGHGLIMTFLITILIFKLLNILKERKDLISIGIWVTLFITFFIATNSLYFWRNALIFQFVYLFEPKANFQKKKEMSD